MFYGALHGLQIPKVSELNTTKVKKNVYVNSEFIFALGSKVERWSRDHDPFLSAEISARSFVSLLSEKNLSCHLTMNL